MALPDKQREARGGTARKQKKNMSRETQELMPARAGGLWPRMWHRLRLEAPEAYRNMLQLFSLL